MRVSVNLNNPNEAVDPDRSILSRLKSCICGLSIWNIFRLLLLFVVSLLLLTFTRTYTKEVLIWLSRQDSVLLYVIVILLLIFVSFPFCVGYIAIVCATGYLFGFAIGLALSIFGANLGVLIAHSAMKLLGQHSYVRSLMTSMTASAIIRVISGSSSLKIIFCTRLTPIPFGLQNCIFAFTGVNGLFYHLATFVGLLPGQIVAVYAGSSLRSIQDVFDNQQISLYTYLVAALQLVLATCLLVWLGTKARNELRLAISEAETKLNLKDIKSTNFSTSLNNIV